MRNTLTGYLLIGLACLPLVPLALRQSAAGLGAWWGQYGTLDGWQGVSVFTHSALTQSVGFALIPFAALPGWLLALILALVLLGVVRQPWWFLAGWLAPLSLAYIASALGRYPFEGRYLLFAAPTVYALLGMGLVHLRLSPDDSGSSKHLNGVTPTWSRAFRRWSTSAPGPHPQDQNRLKPRLQADQFVACVIVFSIMVTAWPRLTLPVPWAAHPPREEIHPLLAEVQARRHLDEAVYITYGATPAVQHYQALGMAPVNALLESGWPAGRVDYQAGRALAAAWGRRRLWVIVAHAQLGEEEGLAHALARRGAWLRERVVAPGATALLWEIRD